MLPVATCNRSIDSSKHAVLMNIGMTNKSLTLHHFNQYNNLGRKDSLVKEVLDGWSWKSVE